MQRETVLGTVHLCPNTAEPDIRLAVPIKPPAIQWKENQGSIKSRKQLSFFLISAYILPSWREIYLDFVLSLKEGWRDHEAGAPEKLGVPGPGDGVPGKLLAKRPDHSVAAGVVMVEQGVEVGQQRVTNLI